MSWTNRAARWLACSTFLTITGAGGAGCLSRPVGKLPPTTKVNFTASISQQAVDKVDLLFAIDNSGSMADKQVILSQAVPRLLEGLLKPRCVDANGAPVGTAVADPTGSTDNNYSCPANSEPEFKPVSDMHIGVVSSSLGGMGGDICPDAGRFNDKGHLLNYVKGGGSVPQAAPSNFLSWYPSNKENQNTDRHPPPPTTAIGDLTALSDAFQKLVVGVEETGCGLEAQLESVYHFLIQPDPWTKIALDANGQATLGGDGDIDVEILQQRADFLRPDSLVAVIMLTDEDDSSADPLSVNGQGWAFMATKFPGSPQNRNDGQSSTAPRPTSTCATNPGETGLQADGKTPNGQTPCTSCGFAATCNTGDPVCALIKSDPNCQTNGGYYGATEDNLNVRFHRMKQRFGIDPQYPIRRYVDGFTKARVPNRKEEHPEQPSGGRRQIEGYTSGGGSCRNPLFASKLPRAVGEEICNLTPSNRSADLVFFAIVGGVPNQLLHFNANDPEASRITDADWNKILGKDPINYDYSGIDTHMIQSVAPRPGLEPPSTTRGDNGDDPVHGREWDTANDDLQYACTFPLPQPRIANEPSDDCYVAKNPPLCGTAPGEQIRAKAYPTIRELMVARALGDQGIVASLCPISLTVNPADPTYGYNPAVKVIIDRLKNALTQQCLPQKLTRDESNQVPCLVLAQLAPDQSCAQHGLAEPSKEILDVFREQQKATGGEGLASLPVCVVEQVAVAQGETCKDAPEIRWCYVQNSSTAQPAGRCPQALIFSQGSSQLAGATFSLQCIQQFAAGEAAGQPDAPATNP